MLLLQFLYRDKIFENKRHEQVIPQTTQLSLKTQFLPAAKDAPGPPLW